MKQRAEGRVGAAVAALSLVGFLVAAPAHAQGGRADADEREAAAQAASFDAVTARVVNEAIELMTADDVAGAAQKLATLRLDRLSPYERGRVEQVLFNIALSQERYEEARGHLRQAIDSGGLNAQEVDQARYQSAQLYIYEGKLREGAAALEEWLETASNPNSAAFYSLAAAYYQLEDFVRALPPARKAVELMDPAKPNENWLTLLLTLYLHGEQYEEAVPVLHRLVAVAPGKKAYWTQLSSVYVALEDYANGLAAMQLASYAGLVTEDSDVRRLVDLLVYNGVPYRGAQLLEAAIADGAVALDEKLYEKLANCWMAAGELDRSVAPLERAAEMAPSGDTFVRLGELQLQRRDWPAMIAAVQRGVDKGRLADPGNAQLLLGIAHYSRKDFASAVPFFERAREFSKHRSLAESYLQAIRAQS